MKESNSKVISASSMKHYSMFSNQRRIRVWTWAMIAVWSLSILASFFWNDQQVRSLIMEQAESSLRTSFFKDLTFRQWATKQGGVYVPVTEEVQPDPYIDFIPERDVVTPTGRVLTLINPALMVRMLNEISHKNSRSQGHISSLRPLNPKNKPDAWEAKALAMFEAGKKGVDEITEISNIDGSPYLRLIHTLIMNDQCLACHEQQGYKLGDIAGGVSVSVPLFELEQTAHNKIMKIGIGHGVLWAMGMIAILFGNRKLIQGSEESNSAYEALSENETRTRNILSTSLDAVVTIDAMDVVTGWSEQAEVIFGWSSIESLGKKLSDLIVPLKHRKQHLEGISNYLKTDESRWNKKRMEVTALNKEGEEFPVELTVSSIIVDGKSAFSAFIRDISDQKKAAKKINDDYHSQRVIASVLEISTLSIPFKEKLKKSLDVILSTPWLTLQGTGMIFVVDSDSDKLVMAAQSGVSELIQNKCRNVKFGHCLCGKTAQSEKVIFSSCLDQRHDVHYDGMKEHGHYCVPIKTEGKLVGILNLYLDHGHKEIDEELSFLNIIANTLGNMFHQYENEERLQYYAYYDELTSLPNRTLFIDRLDQCIKHTVRHPDYMYAVLFLDLDRFKNINDSLGHAVGDQVLRHVSDRLKKCVRDIDTVSRLGGDEFAILLDDVDELTDAYQAAVRIHNELVNPLQLERNEVFTSASIGIVSDVCSYKNHSDLLRDADIAMYCAKQKGNGQTKIFDEKMHANAVNTLSIETELRRAVEREEFCLYMQPIVSIDKNKIVGFESLIRWNSPDRGLVLPDEFIPIAEETGLINEIGLWVLDESCRQIMLWNDSYPKYESLYISVNLSPVQFQNKDFVKNIDAQLKKVAFDNANLRLEITENILMENPEMASQILRNLKERGIRLYLDDFGTGYSSLSYIHNFPFDTLKIDRSFVDKITTGKEHIGMVKSIIAVANNFNMDVIAEGVETKEQLLILEELGCKNIQGYYFSKPVTTVEAEKMLKDEFIYNC